MALFLLSYRPRSGGNYSVSPARFFRLRQSEQDFFVLLNNSTPSIPATTYPPYSPFTKYTVAFYDIDRLLVDLTDLIWVYLGKKFTDCINFGYLSMYAVFQSFSHTFRRRKNCVKTLILQHQKEQCRHDDIKQWDRSSFSFVR